MNKTAPPPSFDLTSPYLEKEYPFIRIAATKNIETSIRVLSWNILADSYVRPHKSNYYEKSLASSSNRSKLIVFYRSLTS